MTGSTITVTWPLATTRGNGATSLPSAQIADTKMYLSQNGGAYSLYQTRAPSEVQNAVITNCPPGVYAFKFTTVDTNGQEGPMSAAVSQTTVTILPALPDPPNVASVTVVVS